MKNEHNLRRSAVSRLNRAIREARAVATIGESLKEEFSPDMMHDLREHAESVLQCVHEYNAYWNAYSEECVEYSRKAPE